MHLNVVAHAARIGAELGADIIKTNYTGDIETFKTVVESCPVPVVIAGGPKCKSNQEVLQTTCDALKLEPQDSQLDETCSNAKTQPKYVKALSAIVHQNASVEQALKILGEKR